MAKVYPDIPTWLISKRFLFQPNPSHVFFQCLYNYRPDTALKWVRKMAGSYITVIMALELKKYQEKIKHFGLN